MDGPDVYITNNITEEDFEKRQPKAIYYNRMIGDEILKWQSKYHFKIVVDIDDYWELNPSHILYQYHIENRVAEHQVKHLKIADVVTTTHERLAEKIYQYNKNVIVVPNAIPTHEYFPVNKTASEYRRIFWQGSVTHEHDIALLRGPIRRLDKARFMMVMAGIATDDAWNNMINCYTNGLKMKGVLLEGLPPHEYYRNYQYADICVIPLVDNTFNSFKSNLKVLEAAHSGLPVIASHVNPYLDMPLLYVKKQSDWYKWINDEAAQKEQAAELSAFCKKNYDFDTINKIRKEAFV